MNIFRKILFFILIFACGGFLIASTPAKAKVKADAETTLNTELFLPSTYFEFYKLNNPIDICQDENYIYVAESNALVLYDIKSELYTRISLTSFNSSITNVTKIDCYKGNVFILNNSIIYYYSVSDKNLVATDLKVANYFSISGDHVYTNTSASIMVNKIVENGNGFSFEVLSTFVSGHLKDTPTNSLVYSPSTNNLYYFTLSGCTVRNLTTNEETSPFSETTYYAKAVNGSIYYTSDNKLYEINEASQTNKVLFDLDPENLSVANNEIKGFSIYQDKILIVHSTKNEVCQYDFSSGYTGVSIATTKKAVNRLTENVIDVIYDSEYVYALQKESLLRFSTTKKEYKEITFIDNEFSLPSFSPKYLAVDGNTLIISNGDDLRAFKLITNEDGSLVCENVNIIFPADWDYNNISGIRTFDGNFYLLKNKTINNVQNAVIIKLHYSKAQKSFYVNTNEYLFKISGNGQDFTISPFGDLYLLLNKSPQEKTVVCYDIVTNRLSSTQRSFYATQAKLFCDFENVYYLNGNRIYNLNNNKSYLIEKNPNLPNDTPIGITINLTESMVYLLYKGYILKTTDLPLISPNSFKIPKELYSKFYSDIKTYKLASGAKIFEVDCSEEYFNYKNVTSCLDKEYIFVSTLEESNNFCLINYEYKSYLVRTSDLIVEDSNNVKTFTPQITKGYYVTRAGSYGLPILNFEQYVSAVTSGVFRLKTVGAFTQVEILNGLEINNEQFYLVKFNDGSLGYIQTSFIATTINYFLADISSTKVYNVFGEEIGTISPRKIKVYGTENNMFIIDYLGGYGYVPKEAISNNFNNRENFFFANIKETTFTSFSGETFTLPAQRIKIFAMENNRYIVEFNDQYGYIESNAVIKQKNNAIRNSVIVIILATNFFITAIYLQIRYNRKVDL